MGEDTDGRSTGRVTDRRRFVQGAAALGAAGLAGCGHVDIPTESPRGTSTPIPNDVLTDDVHGLPLNSALVEGAFAATGGGDRTLRIPVGGSGPDAKNANWNIWAQTGSVPGGIGGLLLSKLGSVNKRTGEPHYYLLEEVTGGVDHIDVVVREGMKWSNGEPYTAKDLWASSQFNFVSNQFFEAKSYLPDPTAGEQFLELRADENTMRIHLKEPRRPEFFAMEFLIGGFGTRSARFKYEWVSEYVDRVRDAVADGDTDRLAEIQQDLAGAGRRDPLRISDEEMLYHGPFVLEERQNNGVLLTRNPEFPRDKFVDEGETALNYDTVKAIGLRNPQAEWKGLTDKEVQLSTTQFSPVLTLQERPENVKLAVNGSWRGVGMLFDHTHVDFQHRKVRQAMAWALGQDQIAKNMSLLWWKPAGRPDGIRINDRQWLGEYDDAFESYSPQESDYERAATKLREAGYTKEDGEWYRPDGDRFKFTWIVRGQHAGIVQTATQQLTDFGVGVEQLTSSFGSFPDEIVNKDWGAALNWVWMFRPHPWFAFNHTFVSEWIPDHMNYAGWNPENGASGTGNSTEGVTPGEFIVEAPPIGEWDGEPRPVNVKEIHTKMGDPSADIDEKAAVQQLAWIYNYDLPKVPIVTKQEGKFYNTEGKDGGWSVAGPEETQYVSGTVQAPTETGRGGTPTGGSPTDGA